MKRQAGFSLMEAIIALVVASMVLSAILPIASRAVSDNLRIGLRGLDQFELSLQEQSYRHLSQIVLPAPTRRGAEPALDMLEGDASKITTWGLAEFQTLCAPVNRLVQVTLQIEQQGSAGRLTCTADERVGVVLGWVDAQGAFAFSEDGKAWSAVWPLRRSVAGPVDFDAPTGPLMVEAPLVRFTLTRGAETLVSWIAPFGVTQPADYLLDDMSTAPVTPP